MHLLTNAALCVALNVIGKTVEIAERNYVVSKQAGYLATHRAAADIFHHYAAAPPVPIDMLLERPKPIRGFAVAVQGNVEKVGVAPEPKRVGPASQNLEYG